MKVISCNIGEIATLKWRGKDVKTGINKYPVENIFLGDKDVEQDHVIDRKYHGGIDQACYLYGINQYNYWQKQYPDLDWHYGFLGENITIDGLDESTTIVGQIYQLGEAIVKITKPRNPCFKLGIIMGTKKAVHDFWLAPYPGVYLQIIENGMVKPGDTMTLLHDCVGPSILDVYEAKRKRKM